MRIALSIMLTLAAPAFASDSGFALFHEVVAATRLCSFAQTPTAILECRINTAPKKCEVEARDAVTGPAAHSRYRNCVMSCANAGYLSRSIGECSRALIIENAGANLAAMSTMNCFAEWSQTGLFLEQCLSVARDY